MNNENTQEILRDLIIINNDRIEGYKKAIDESSSLDADLKSLFQQMISESEGYKSELSQELIRIGGKLEEDATTLSGKIYRAWMDLKVSFSGNDRIAILENCEYGEDAWRKTYKSALENTEDLSPDQVALITKQLSSEKPSHDMIRRMRDNAKANVIS